MLFTSAALALVALLPAVLGGPVHKRATGQIIKSGRTGTCLSLIPGTQLVNGALLTYVDCTRATLWDISPGSGSVIVSGTGYALDAGVPQGNNNIGKVWQSYPGSPQQTWYLTADNRIAVTGGNQCLDAGTNGPQTYQCTPGNTNQVWLVSAPPNGPSSASSSIQPPPSSSSSSAAPPTATGKQLKWVTNQSLCATVQGSAAGNGVLVNMNNCVNPSMGQQGQLFNFLGNGQIQYSGSNYCLDAGSNPANGVQMKLWQCYPGLAQQTWSIASPGPFSTANNQCLDLDSASFSKLQTWACSAPDPQQKFVIV